MWVSCTTTSVNNGLDDSFLGNLESDSLYTKGIFYYNKTLDDKAYIYLTKSINNTKKFKDSLTTASSYYHIAKIEYHHTNYISAEEKAVSALQYCPKTKHGQKLKARINSLLGTLAIGQLDYDEALVYYAKHFSLYRPIHNDRESIRYYNNMGRVFFKKRSYQKAIQYYDSVLAIKNVISKFPVQYARIISNKAESLFEIRHDNGEIYKLLTQALNLRIKYADLPGQVHSYIGLSRYHLNKGQLSKAKAHAIAGKKIANSIGDTEGILELYKILAQVEPQKASQYFLRHASLKDSLVKRERLFKKQAAKIQYNSELNEQKIIQQNKKINQRNKTIIWGGIFLLLAIASSIVLNNQKNKIHKQNKQIIALQKEVHHHAKNDLERVMAFLLQIRETNKNTSLKDLQYKISAMINLHLQLYTENDNEQIDMQKYFESLTTNIHQAYNTEKKNIQYFVSAPASISAKKAKHIGLIVNELIINIYKHAYTEQDKGEYKIDFTQSDKEFTLTIEDNGLGLPLGFEIKNSNSFGLEFVDDTCTQEDFELKITPLQKGTRIIINGKNKE